MLALVPGSVIIFVCFFCIGSSQIRRSESNTNLRSNYSENLVHIFDTQNDSLPYLPIIPKSSNVSHTEEVITFGNETFTTVLTKSKTKKRKKNRRKRRRRKNIQGQHSTTDLAITANAIQQTTESQTVPSRRRRRKFRKRKPKRLNNNILEITTAKAIPKNKTNFNFTENEIVQSLNKNPEQNFLKKKRKKIKSKFALSNNSSGNLFIRGEDNNVWSFQNITLFNNNSQTTTKKYKRRFNRCRKKNGGCSQLCKRKGKQKCSCLKGFVLTTDGTTCDDIDECKINNGGCQFQCFNNLGSYECRCPAGLRLAYDMKSCIDVNECLLRNGHGPCQGTCRNTLGSYSCSCENVKGTKLGEDGRTCQDLDECLQNNGGCSHTCINVFGNVYCSCPEGWELSTDWKTCQDINECQQDNVSEFCNYTCINTEGSYKCQENTYMLSDQEPLNVVCKPLFLPRKGYLNCSRDNSFTFYTRKGRKRITNSVGTNCKLVCPTGYQMVGEYDITCGINGKWSGNRTAKCLRSNPPTLECPPKQIFKIIKKNEEALVQFPPPITNIHWRFIKSRPAWAKNLTGYLNEGSHDIMFIAKDPKTRLISSCIFKVVVKLNND